MIAAIRIRGLVGIKKDIKSALNILRLKKKYSCVLVSGEADKMGMLKKTKDCITFGEIDKETLKELISKRGKLVGDKPIGMKEKELNDFVDDILSGKAKFGEKNIKPFFRLHPPRGGFKKSTKKQYPHGVLGKNNRINELIRRML